ncbi:hypothetical protein MKEN_01424700 [Mycena kentingensis (nom. inval.)]|nr:hypothetical protein MKEN_01424700 [Mycena kentingensis (nom. inval.)]
MAAFDSFPDHLQRRIDNAFNACASPTTTPSKPDFGGGFLIDDGDDHTEPPTRISLSAIPSALQALDLPPDDEQVLTVFRNAATGWASATNDVAAPSSSQGAEMYVTRDDWRSVCAVLFEHHAEEYAESDGPGPEAAGGYEEDEDEDKDGDAYEANDDDDSDSDEYMEEDDDDDRPGPSTRRRRPATRKRARSSSSSSSAPKKLTPRQRKTCLDTYALFFPDAAPDELPQRRVMIKDVQRLTQLIGDKYKSEEIIEMVEEFSTSPDKSMSFADFGAMMLAAKLA